MSNKITEKYFKYCAEEKDLKRIIEKIIAKTNFKIEKEIFRGLIYDKNKIGSIIYKGIWKNKIVVLKIQFLKPEIDEINIIKKFNKQNKSKIIRLPRLYQSAKWNPRTGYGYLIMEYIDAKPIYQTPLASKKEIKTFVNFYKEYKTKSLIKPLFKIQLEEKNYYNFIKIRAEHWLKIAKTKNKINKETTDCFKKFLSTTKKYSPEIKMQFMHGHLMSRDIYQVSIKKFVLMSNLFWSYRPEYADAVFHLWAGIKSIRDLKVKPKKVINYTQKWLKEYKKLDFIKQDYDFEKKFNIMMLERCIGAMLVDIENQEYKNNANKHKKHLKTIFRNLFDYYSAKL
jgi:hypothetical protein